MRSTLFEPAANGFYRQAARISAGWLGRSPIVESIFVHRSVAAGEVSFGRSDIDLVTVVRQANSADQNGPELGDLYRRMRRLRRLNPALGHIEVHDAPGFQDWLRVDTYRGSMERRGALFVYGEPIPMSTRPVLAEHAARWCALFPHYFLTPAIRRTNRRNLRKIALEVWNAYATATGRVAEPFLTRRETAAFHHESGERPSAAGLDWRVDRTVRFLMQTAAKLHDEMLPPLRRLAEPLVFTALLPPTFHKATFIVVPDGEAELLREAVGQQAVIVTPELLHLYVHFANAFAFPIIPDELRDLGIEAPDQAAFQRTAQYEFHGQWWRGPGFVHPFTGGLHSRLILFRHTVEHLERGETPAAMDAQAVSADVHPTIDEYYAQHYAPLAREQKELWARLARLT
jgi:hypothetical protein